MQSLKLRESGDWGFFFAPESGSGGLDAMRSVPERIRGSEGKPSAAVTEFTYRDR